MSNRQVTDEYRRVTDEYRRVTDNDYRRVYFLNTTNKQHSDGLFIYFEMMQHFSKWGLAAAVCEISVFSRYCV